MSTELPEKVKPSPTLGYFDAIPHTATRRIDLSDSAKIVLGYLASYWYQGLECYPSLRTISRETGRNQRTARRALHELQKEHWIIRKWRDWETTVYSPGPNLGIISPFWKDSREDQLRHLMGLNKLT